MYWYLMTHMWKYLPIGEEVSYSKRIFGALLVLGLLMGCAGLIFKRRILLRLGFSICILVPAFWGWLYLTRPAWLRIAAEPQVPVPTCAGIQWQTRQPGFETSETDLLVNDEVVDHVVLVRVDPSRYKFSVHWDGSGSRTAEDWQKELGAVVVVNGSYFGQTNDPLTPLRTDGHPAGPTVYASDNGAFVADGGKVAIIDLRHQDLFKAIGAYPNAMVSYPLLIDPDGVNRAKETRVWLASRNFVAIDKSGRVVLGTTQTGFFTLHRLGDFLKTAPLDLKVALNFDGGPLVSQVVKVGGFERKFYGKAEMTDGSDVLRALWHAHVDPPSHLPVVLVAVPL